MAALNREVHRTWLTLFDAAAEVLGAAERPLGGKFDWTVGGGTMLYRLYQHRHSKDIDIFVGDARLLPYLSPRLNEVAARYAEGSGASYVEQSNFVKLTLAGPRVA